jgi:hypothetical protein
LKLQKEGTHAAAQAFDFPIREIAVTGDTDDQRRNDPHACLP